MTPINRQVPNLVVRQEQPYLSIPIQVAQKEWKKATALVSELIEWMDEHRIEWAGPPFFRYWIIGDMDTHFHIEVGIPVVAPLAGDGRVIPGTIPGGIYATLVHTGSPDALDLSLSILQTWGIHQGLQWNNQIEGDTEIWGARFEFYLTDPALQPNQEKWSVEIAYQVKVDRDN
jgi:effector-binding domain-containing protein